MFLLFQLKTAGRVSQTISRSIITTMSNSHSFILSLSLSLPLSLLTSVYRLSFSFSISPSLFLSLSLSVSLALPLSLSLCRCSFVFSSQPLENRGLERGREKKKKSKMTTVINYSFFSPSVKQTMKERSRACRNTNSIKSQGQLKHSLAGTQTEQSPAHPLTARLAELTSPRHRGRESHPRDPTRRFPGY